MICVILVNFLLFSSLSHWDLHLVWLPYLLMRVCVLFQGRITVTGLLDREKGDMYTLTVVADDGGPKKDSTVVRPFVVNGVVSGLPLLLLCLVDLLLHVFVSILAQKANGLPLLLIASLSGTAEGKTFFLWGMLSTTVNAFAV